MSSIVDLSHNYKLVRDRLQHPSNAVTDIGIDLKRKRIPPPPPVDKVVLDYSKAEVTIREVIHNIITQPNEEQRAINQFGCELDALISRVQGRDKGEPWCSISSKLSEIQGIVKPMVGKIKVIKIAGIIEAVCDHFHVFPKTIRGHSRDANSVRPRHIIFYLACTHTGLSLPQIGRLVGGRDHTTILHGRNKIREMLLVDEALAADVHQIEFRLFAGLYDKDNNNRPALAAVSQSVVAQQGPEGLPKPEIRSVD